MLQFKALGKNAIRSTFFEPCLLSTQCTFVDIDLHDKRQLYPIIAPIIWNVESACRLEPFKTGFYIWAQYLNVCPSHFQCHQCTQAGVWQLFRLTDRETDLCMDDIATARNRNLENQPSFWGLDLCSELHVTDTISSQNDIWNCLKFMCFYGWVLRQHKVSNSTVINFWKTAF